MSIEFWLLPSLLALIAWGVSAFAPRLAIDALSPFKIIVYQVAGCVLFALGLFAWKGFTLGWNLNGALLGTSIGILGMAGQIFYVVALGRGKVAPVSVVTSLYPALTIGLAILFLNETLVLRQALGAVLAVTALVLLVLQKQDDGTGGCGREWLLPSFICMIVWGVWAFIPKLALQMLEPEDVLIYESMGNAIVGLCLLGRLRFRIEVKAEGFIYCTAASLIAMSGVLAYLYALKHGPVSIVAVLAALYPVVTILLARVLLKEKMNAAQKIAVVVALGAVGLMTV